MTDTELLPIIRQTIRQLGPLNVADYMGLCLGHPQHGYYMKQDPFGKDGDFTTAPEISQIFGELIGLWLMQAWQDRHAPAQIHLIEFGPGRGTLMADIMRAAKMIPQFQGAVHIHLVEMSPSLQAIQKKTLANYSVTWHQDLSTLPPPTPAQPQFIIGNEFFDALPIHQLVYKDQKWRDRLISWNEKESKLGWIISPQQSQLANFVSPSLTDKARDFDIIELSPVSENIATAIGQHINKSNGVGLFIDYGYAKTALGDSFQALIKHQFCDCLEYCGDADLTAHVNFEALENSFQHAECRVAPLITQETFLTRLGASARAQQLMHHATAPQKKNIETALHRLIAPEEMGTLFKTIAISAKDGPTLAAFEATS